jgi:hypothetical protein
MRGTVARTVGALAAITAGLVLPAAAAADGVPQPANVENATDIITGWHAVVAGQRVVVNFTAYANLDGVVEHFGFDVPLANLQGMTIAQIQQPNNPQVLKVLLNERQGNAFKGQSGIWDVSEDIAQAIGPALTAAMEKWFTAQDLYTQGLAGGPIPPVPADVPPDPAVGVYCNFWVGSGPPPPALLKPCVAPPATIDANGVVQWPGYPPSVTQAAAAAPTPAQVVSSATQAVAQAVQSVLPKTEQSSAASSSTGSGGSASKAASAAATTPVPKPSPTSNPTDAEGIQQAAAQVDKPVPVTGMCQDDKDHAIPCTQDPKYAGTVTPQDVTAAKQTLRQEAATNRARAPWRNAGAVALMLGLLLLVAGGVAVLARRPERWGDVVYLPKVHRVGRALLLAGVPLLVVGTAVYLANPLIP